MSADSRLLSAFKHRLFQPLKIGVKSAYIIINEKITTKMKRLVCVIIIILLYCAISIAYSKGFEPWTQHLNVLQPSVSSEAQEKAVEGLISRLLPQHQHLFAFKVDPSISEDKKDVFKITSPMAANDNRVYIQGTTGVAAAWGLLHYLKYYCNAHVSWEADQLDLPKPLPKAYVKIVALDRFRYHQNVCTVSYSFAWWKWARWERHIDWMALNGINFPLAFTAQEAIWRKVYLALNFTEEDLNDHFVGPAFLAWGRMGNIQKWQGPLRSSWHDQTLALQHQILKRMREFGMIPILPAFAGHVPSAITRLYPSANVTRLTAWSHFKSDNYTRTYLLDPRDKLFSQIGVSFIKEMQREFNGTNHVYNCDTFNEMTPPNGTTPYLRAVGKAIFKAMTTADPSAIWVMQGWIFRDAEFWSYKRSKALLTSVPQGKMIVLDLTTEVDPVYIRLDSYFGQPFIFCMLHNYGGVDGFYGNVDILLKNMENARTYPNVTLIGTGLTPEGINQNYVIYDLMLELAWRREKINVSQWAKDYSVRRYGCESSLLQEAWEILFNSIYNCDELRRFHGNSILIQHRPNFLRLSSLWYNISDLLQAWDNFILAIDEDLLNISEVNITSRLKSNDLSFEINSDWEIDFSKRFEMKDRNFSTGNFSESISSETTGCSLRDKETFRHDLVDISRQALQVLGDQFIELLRMSYIVQCQNSLNKTGNLLINLLRDLDTLLLTSKDFLLGSWLSDAASWATNKEEKEQYISNALYQISLWGPNGEIIDYAVKQWNGVVFDYMLPRWMLFIDELLICMKEGKAFNQKDFNVAVFEKAEKYFADGKGGTNYWPTPRGDPIEQAKFVHKVYRPLFKEDLFSSAYFNKDLINAI